jgi:c-di-AMP phosphodiesterase-like protein
MIHSAVIIVFIIFYFSKMVGCVYYCLNIICIFMLYRMRRKEKQMKVNNSNGNNNKVEKYKNNKFEF